MKNDKFFLDTNVVLYSVSGELKKADIADELIDAGNFISVQILNESVHVMRKKWKQPWSQVRNFLEYLEISCKIVSLDLETHNRAADISEATGITIFDALLVAAAEQADCSVLITEDLNDGQRIGSVRVRNPFI